MRESELGLSLVPLPSPPLTLLIRTVEPGPEHQTGPDMLCCGGQTGVCATMLHSVDQVQSTGRCRCNRRITFVYRSSWDRKRIRLGQNFLEIAGRSRVLSRVSCCGNLLPSRSYAAFSFFVTSFSFFSLLLLSSVRDDNTFFYFYVVIRYVRVLNCVVN